MASVPGRLWAVSRRHPSQLLSPFLLPMNPRRCFTVRNRLRDSKLCPCLLMQHFAKRVSVEILHNFQLSYSTVVPRGQACLVYATRALKWCSHEISFPLACNFHTKSWIMREIKETEKPPSQLRALTASCSFWSGRGDRSTPFLISYSFAFLMWFLEVTQLKSHFISFLVQL